MDSFVVNDNLKKETFVIQSKLGEGSFGLVYSVKKIGMGTMMALKVVERKDKAQKEADIMSILSHPNIIEFHSFFIDQDRAYISMKQAEMSVAALLPTRHHFSDPECRSFLRDIIHGLVYLKTKLIVHRDIKPGNLLINGHRRIQICDFSNAVKLDTMDQVIRGMGGTLLYTASEVLNIHEWYSFPVDVFSAGACLHEFMCGVAAFDFGIPEPSRDSLIRYIARGNYNPLSSSYYSPSGVALVQQMMNPSSKKRISCENILKSSFLKDFYIPSVLPRHIFNHPPEYYIFFREQLNPVRLYQQSIYDTMKTIVANVSANTVGSGQNNIAPLTLSPQTVSLSSLLFADVVHLTDHGFSYHLTTGTVGFHFLQDSTSIIEAMIQNSLNNIYFDAEQNGRIFQDQDAKGSILKKLGIFRVSQTRMKESRQVQISQNEQEQLTEAQERVHVWKWYEAHGKLMLGFTNGNIQIVDTMSRKTFILTRENFIVTAHNTLLGESYTWASLMEQPELIKDTLCAHIAQSMTDTAHFIKQ